MKHRIRKYWHKLIIHLFRQHFQDELAECIHPEFGWLWQEGGEGYKYCEQHRNIGKWLSIFDLKRRLGMPAFTEPMPTWEQAVAGLVMAYEDRAKEAVDKVAFKIDTTSEAGREALDGVIRGSLINSGV